MANQKKLFAVVGSTNPSKMSAKLLEVFPGEHLHLGAGQWLLVGDITATTTEISIKLRITGPGESAPEDNPGLAIVLSVSNYFGRAPVTTWEWITAKLGGTEIVAG